LHLIQFVRISLDRAAAEMLAKKLSVSKAFDGKAAAAG
jgi:hypothetical protein